MKTLEEKQKELVKLPVITSVDELREAYANEYDSWVILKEVFIDQMYTEWCKHATADQFSHQLYYQKIKEMTDYQIFEQIKNEISKSSSFK